MAKTLFLLKLQHLKQRMCQRVVLVKNQLAISPQLSSLVPHGINKPFQHLHIYFLINIGHLRYKFKVGDTPSVKKADQHCFDLGI
jgi:hypothetical protein